MTPSFAGSRPARHMPQLDALRALAVTAVVVHHSVPGGWGFGADIGVKLFFTLSGFLITGLLLRGGDSVHAGRETFAQAIGRFYARRFLRIFPLYYFAIAVAFIVGFPPTREIIWRLLTYTINIHMARQGWYEAGFAHFWSLAVEEQFYVVWPWVVFLAPRRALVWCIAVMILLAPAYRLSYVLTGYDNMTALSSYISTWSCLDSLGCGAMLTFAERAVPATVLDRWLFRRLLPVSVLVCAGLKVYTGGPAPSLVVYPLSQAVALTAVIRAAAHGMTGAGRVVLESRPLLYLGKISYGIYVYHPFVRTLCQWMGERLAWRTSPEGWPIGFLAAAATLMVASASWHLYERPLNDLKRRFRDPI